MALEQVTAFTLTGYSPDIAAGIGQLVPYVDPSYSGEPIQQERLEDIIASDYHDQIVAVWRGRIVGAATMSLILEPGLEGVGHLNTFVTDPRLEDEWVDYELWDAVEEWSDNHNAPLIEFKSKMSQDPAYKFFLEQGATEVTGTALFKRTIPTEVADLSDLSISALAEYDEEQAADLGRLMQQLDSSFSDEPIPKDHLERIIKSPYHDQLVAIRDGRVVGAATMSLLRNPTSEGVGYLGAFVTDENGARGQGVGGQIWEDMEKWTAAKGLPAFEFKSGYHRVKAHRFYKNHGAPIIEDGSTFFEYVVPSVD